MRTAGEQPRIEIAVEAGGWPPEAELQKIAERAVAAAVAVLREGDGWRDPSPSPSPQGGGGLVEESELSILFTDDSAVQKLNAAWRGKDKPTNVLSFPQPAGPLLGDVILAAETLREEAALAQKAFEDHMAHLIVHGFLHLLGYDHEGDAEAEAMEAVERKALARMGIADPYAPAREK